MKLIDSENQLTEKELSAFEKKYNYKLPKSYRDLILKFNGGFPEKPYFEEDEIYFTPITHGEMTMENLLDVTDASFLPTGYFPFADAGEIIYCIDTKSSNGEVYRLTEDGEVTKVSSSFDDFIEALSE